MLQRLPIALAQVKVGNTSYRLKQTAKIKVYNTKMYTIFMNSENSTTSDSNRLLINLADKID